MNQTKISLQFLIGPVQWPNNVRCLEGNSTVQHSKCTLVAITRLDNEADKVVKLSEDFATILVSHALAVVEKIAR